MNKNGETEARNKVYNSGNLQNKIVLPQSPLIGNTTTVLGLPPQVKKEDLLQDNRQEIPSFRSEESEFGPGTIAHAATIAASAVSQEREEDRPSSLQTRTEIPSVNSLNSEFGPETIAQAAYLAAGGLGSPTEKQDREFVPTATNQISYNSGQRRRRPSSQSQSRSRTSTIDSARFSGRHSNSGDSLCQSTQIRTLHRDPLPELSVSLSDVPEVGTGLTPTVMTPSENGSFSAFAELVNLATPEPSPLKDGQNHYFNQQDDENNDDQFSSSVKTQHDEQNASTQPPIANVLYSQQLAAYAQMLHYQQQTSGQARAYLAMQQYALQQQFQLQQLHYQQQQQPNIPPLLDPSLVPTPTMMMPPPPHLQQLHHYMILQQQQQQQQQFNDKNKVTALSEQERQQMIAQQILEYQRQQQLFFRGGRPPSAVIPSPPPIDESNAQDIKKLNQLESDHSIRRGDQAQLKNQVSTEASYQNLPTTQRFNSAIGRFFSSTILGGRNKCNRQDSTATVEPRSPGSKSKRKLGPINNGSPLKVQEGHIDELRQSSDSHFGDSEDDIPFSPILADDSSPKKRAVDDFYQNCPNSPSSPSPTRAVRCDDSNSSFRRRPPPPAQSRFASVIIDPLSLSQAELENGSNLECPAYEDLINFARSKGRGTAHRCVMCGLEGRPPPKNNDEMSETMKNDVNGNEIVIIPTQNKDVCKTCDTVSWRFQQTGAFFKWCKGCKRFHKLASFAGKLKASKCDDSRARGRAGYMRRKEPTPSCTAPAPAIPIQPTRGPIAPTTTTLL